MPSTRRSVMPKAARLSLEVTTMRSARKTHDLLFSVANPVGLSVTVLQDDQTS